MSHVTPEVLQCAVSNFRNVLCYVAYLWFIKRKVYVYFLLKVHPRVAPPPPGLPVSYRVIVLWLFIVLSFLFDFPVTMCNVQFKKKLCPAVDVKGSRAPSIQSVQSKEGLDEALSVSVLVSPLYLPGEFHHVGVKCGFSVYYFKIMH